MINESLVLEWNTKVVTLVGFIAKVAYQTLCTDRQRFASVLTSSTQFYNAYLRFLSSATLPS